VLSVAGSKAGNVLVGGAGNDKLIGGSGADILIGGAGADSLQAGSGSDILVNGSTIHDADLAALLALSQEWSSGDSFQTRVQDLYHGANLLNAGAVIPDGSKVSNQLIGSSGQDWFWLRAGIDNLLGETANEVVTLE
jgi:Ca2+-binding RTX toxin-like protein